MNTFHSQDTAYNPALPSRLREKIESEKKQGLKLYLDFVIDGTASMYTIFPAVYFAIMHFIESLARYEIHPMMGITVIVLLLEMSTFGMFFRKTGTNLQTILHGFSWAGYLVAAISAVAILILLHFLLRKLSIYNKVKMTFKGIWEGVISLKDVRNIPLFVFFTLGIWVSYFLHYYLTFFCFDFTADLGLGCALVTFIVGSIAVIVPTPNGAGPWHFAVKTMLILYGIADENALCFVLIVHTVQTMLVILLGIYAWVALNFTSKKSINYE